MLSIRTQWLRYCATKTRPVSNSAKQFTQRRKYAIKGSVKHIKFDSKLDLELGGSLPSLDVVYETWGPEDGPVVLVIPALSASSHCRSSTADPRPGWWEEMLGPGKGIDTNHYRVVCPAILGSPFGTTSPVSDNPLTGKPYGPDFPQITTADQATVHGMVLDHLGIEKCSVVGSSLGGMQALQVAAQRSDLVEKVISISATGKTTPGTVALRRVQRKAVMTDPKWKGGHYAPDQQPNEGMLVARELGIICYRSRDEFNERFGWDPQPPYNVGHATFEVEQYLENAAAKFVNKYDANCYLLLSRTMDLHDMGRGSKAYYEGVQRIKGQPYIIGVDRDMLIPPQEQRQLYDLLKALGRKPKYEELSSLYGHDAFLNEHRWFGEHVGKFLSGESTSPFPKYEPKPYHKVNGVSPKRVAEAAL